MTNDELKKIIEKHGKWLKDQDGGERANLRDADLYCATLCGANLCGADLRGAKNTPFIPMTCPDSGSFTAWKIARKHVFILTS